MHVSISIILAWFRFSRHSCHLPDFPPHGKYNYTNPNDNNVSVIAKTYKPGQEVPPYSELTLICKPGYNRTLSRSTEFFCTKHGHWNPNPGGCHSPYTSTYTKSKI